MLQLLKLAFVSWGQSIVDARARWTTWAAIMRAALPAHVWRLCPDVWYAYNEALSGDTAEEAPIVSSCMYGRTNEAMWPPDCCPAVGCRHRPEQAGKAEVDRAHCCSNPRVFCSFDRPNRHAGLRRAQYDGVMDLHGYRRIPL